MRKIIFAAVTAATIIPAVPAPAQQPAWEQTQRREAREDRHDDQRDARQHRRDERDDWREARQDRRADWHAERHNIYYRPDSRDNVRYDAAHYYRHDHSYGERRLSRNDRIYRGNDGRYYCRHSDGSTGLIVGALAGGMLGNALSNGRSSTVYTLLGMTGGAALGRSIDRGDARCR